MSDALVYSGRLNALNGEPGGGKTWVALHTCAEAMREGHQVIYIDLEDTPEGLVGRLRAMGLPPELIAKHLLYLQPELAWGPTVWQGPMLGTRSLRRAASWLLVRTCRWNRQIPFMALPPQSPVKTRMASPLADGWQQRG
jgi:archaellum biogenesis ATPase FlaH